MNYRDEFPVTQQWAFLNHAAVAPLSRRAQQKIHAWTDDMAQNGNVHEAKWWGEIETVRAAAARLLGAETGEIALMLNTSAGIAAIAEGFPWQPGDNVVIAEGEYPANVYPWMHLQSRGVAVKTVPCRDARIDFDDVVATVDAKTRLLSISHVQFSTGYRSDLARLGELCHDRGIDFCVDAIQGMGVFPIDVRQMKIDYLSADGHKWLVGPEGAAVFFINQDKLEKIHPTTVGWKSVVNFADFSTIDFRLRPNASRFEGGTFNVPGLLGLGASLSLFEEIGVATIGQRVKEVTDYLVERLRTAECELVSSRDNDEWSGIVSFIMPDKDPRQVVKHCRERHVVITTRAGRLRASPHFYNDRSDIDRLLDALEESGH